MVRPDFAHTGLARLEGRDLRFLIDNFPGSDHSYEEIVQVIDRLPTTLDSMLDSDYVFNSITCNTTALLNVSPFLLFNVLLRRSMDWERSSEGRRVINYVANTLSLFTHTDRVFRVQPWDRDTSSYLVDMISEAQTADSNRQFLIDVQIGNYSLYLTGLYARWVSHRYKYGRRPINIDYYLDQGRAYYSRASQHLLAREYGLKEVFAHLAETFDHYRQALNTMTTRYLVMGRA